MSPFEVGIWQAAWGSQDRGIHSAAFADERVRQFRVALASGVDMLPVSEGNVCDHKHPVTLEHLYRTDVDVIGAGQPVCSNCGTHIPPRMVDGSR